MTFYFLTIFITGYLQFIIYVLQVDEMTGGNQGGMYADFMIVKEGTCGCYGFGRGMFNKVDVAILVCPSE